MMKTKYFILMLILNVLTVSVDGQSIDSLLNLAYYNNPELKALQLEYEAALQKGPQVSQLPSPIVGVGIPLLQPETRLGPQVLSISASHMFPWFGTLKAKEDVVITMAKSKYERIAAARLDIDHQIKNAYYELYLLNRKQDIIRKNMRIYNALEEVSLACVESGRSIASDVLYVRLKIEELENKDQTLEDQKKVFVARINEALNRSFLEEVVLDEKLMAMAELDFDLELYRSKIQTFHPLIKQLDQKIETSKKELVLNTFSGNPSFGIGLDYSIVNERTDASLDNNGQDILIPKVMFSLPIYRKGFKAKKEEEELMQRSYKLKQEQLTNKMIGLLQLYRSDHENAALSYNLSVKQIEVSQSAYDILIAEYSTKGNKFDELMKLQNDILKYELEQVKAIVKTHIAQSNIDRLTDY